MKGKEMTDTATPAAAGGQSVVDPSAKAKRYRATKEEMAVRERAAIKLLQGSPLTINGLSTASNLPYTKAQALIARLIEEGRVTAIGTDSGRRTVYKITAAAAAAQPKPVVKLPERSFADFLNQFHVGQDLRVVAVHLTEAGATVDVKTDQNVVTMTLAN